MPMWPWWILSSISFRLKDGTRILSPLRMIPFSSDSSSLTSQYTRALELILAFVCGHPRLMISLRSCSDSSIAVSFWISSNLDYETGKLDCIRWTCLLMFLQSAVSGSGVHDSMSGSAKLTVFPVCIPVYSPTFAFSLSLGVGSFLLFLCHHDNLNQAQVLWGSKPSNPGWCVSSTWNVGSW